MNSSQSYRMITCVADMGWGLTRFEDEWRDHAALAADASFPLRMVLVPFEPALRRRYGADRFDFSDLSDSAPGSTDIIRDFSSADGDHLDFSGIDARPGSIADNDFTFISTNDFTKAGQIRAVQSGEDTILQITVDDSLDVALMVKLLNVNAADLSVSDFIL